jgi:hypothetical protein
MDTSHKLPGMKEAFPPTHPHTPSQMAKKQVVLNRFIIFSSLIPPFAL